ncbi:Lysoplasmalogenase [Alteromonas sp. 38]|uniref:lysoplasmalogenase n=1 Tax=Alteromonas TaxID=226 RepID=UPI0012F39811|nr:MULTISPECIES: lysoplasmalogenase [Alteromonas]CAD5249535.1 Lysoplasmalogenase [Alteromonas sp. 154]VXC45199.1 Lysoplasmalogenase [Alteromonas sp. 38]
MKFASHLRHYLNGANLYLLFLITSCFYLLTLTLASYPFQFLPKVLPICILLVTSITMLQGRFRQLISLAIIASGCGDVFLAIQLENGFIFGLISFLVAHIIYIVSFCTQGTMSLSTMNNSLNRWRLVGVLGVIVFALIIGRHILPSTGQLFVPVCVYLAAISLMGITALVFNMSNTIVLGAFCFICSDSILAHSLFKEPFPLSSFLVMTTYYLAQFFIVKGAVSYQGSSAS